VEETDGGGEGEISELVEPTGDSSESGSFSDLHPPL
jgi:hypothetical protein